MDDTISRKAAIDVIEQCKTARASDGEIYVAKINALMKIDALPTAQPEIIHCKDCKFFEYDHLYVINGIPAFGHELCNRWGQGCKTSENGWCFLAERKPRGQ